MRSGGKRNEKEKEEEAETALRMHLYRSQIEWGKKGVEGKEGVGVGVGGWTGGKVGSLCVLSPFAVDCARSERAARRAIRRGGVWRKGLRVNVSRGGGNKGKGRLAAEV